MFARLRRWLFRLEKDGTGPIVLRQRRVFIVPTRAGWVFGIMLLVMLANAVNYGLGLGHALVFLLAGLTLTAMVHTFRNLAWLRLRPGRCDPVFAGEMAHFPLHLHNDRGQPRLALEFRAGRNPSVTCDVAADGDTAIALPVAAEHRGWLELPRVRLSTRYPLGLFVAWSYPHPNMHCLVYPRPLRYPLPEPVGAVTAGQQQARGGTEDFAGLRERAPADSPKHIAWKAAAREVEDQKFLVKQFAGGAESEIWLEWSALPDSMDMETRVSILTGWVLAADAEGVHFGMRSPNQEVPAGSGPDHRALCLEHLALCGKPLGQGDMR